MLKNCDKKPILKIIIQSTLILLLLPTSDFLLLVFLLLIIWLFLLCFVFFHWKFWLFLHTLLRPYFWSLAVLDSLLVFLIWFFSFVFFFIWFFAACESARVLKLSLSEVLRQIAAKHYQLKFNLFDIFTDRNFIKSIDNVITTRLRAY